MPKKLKKKGKLAIGGFSNKKAIDKLSLFESAPSGIDEPKGDAPDVEKLESLANDKDQIPETEKGTSETGPIKKGRGRPKGSKTKIREEEIPAAPFPEILVRLIVEAPYNLMAARKGEHWRLSELELANMIPIHQRLADQYIPDFIKGHADLYAALSMHLIAIIGRVDIERQLAKAQEEQIHAETQGREVTAN